METRLGVVGPRDLVPDVAAFCSEQPGVRTVQLAYSHESEAPAIVGSRASEVDAWLFTGVVPYTLSKERLNRPAAYIDYTGASLLQALVQLLRAGHDVTGLSIDTLSQQDVEDVFREASIPIENIKVLPFRRGQSSQTLVDFHRRNAGDGTVAITCVSTVYEQLDEDLTILRLVPSWHAIRTAVRQLLLLTASQVKEDAQVVLGIVETTPPADPASEEIRTQVAQLAGTVAGYDDGRTLVVTTRGQLAAASDQFSTAPMMAGLRPLFETVHIGFGEGRSAVEAEVLAKRALARARSHGEFGAVASFRNDTDIVLAAGDREEPRSPALEGAGISVLASRVGLSSATLEKIREIAAAGEGAPLTTRDLAEALGVQQRTARRLVQRLELAGVAMRVGRLNAGGSGRPLTQYRVLL